MRFGQLVRVLAVAGYDSALLGLVQRLMPFSQYMFNQPPMPSICDVNKSNVINFNDADGTSVGSFS